MDEFEIRTGSPDSAARGQLLDALLTYNREATGITEDEELSGSLRDEAGDLIAGVYANVALRVLGWLVARPA